MEDEIFGPLLPILTYSDLGKLIEKIKSLPKPLAASEISRRSAASVQSNVDRAEAERLLTRAGAWGWELVYRSIESFIERRKQQRWMAGR